MVEIGEYMRDVLARYDSLRGQKIANSRAEFWNLVIISAGDEEQRRWFAAQLALKADMGDLPLDVPITCISDPEGSRIGSGGATLNILKILSQKYKEEFFKWKIMIIHSGGHSKRLPSHSCSGKIFSPLPILPTKGGPYQMLDLKLAIYLPFLSTMEPGIFITASDDIEVFSINEIKRKRNSDGVTALAHPSSLKIGTGHGVYVLDCQTSGSPSTTEIRACQEVLQKPTVALMKERGATVRDAKGIEQVYSDSAFWFTSSVSKKLLQFYSEVEPLQNELCVYGDFLTFLGSKEDKYYVSQLQRAKQTRANELKLKLCSFLDQVPLDIVLLNRSKFYHLGTMQEYLNGLTNDENLRTELNLHSRVRCRLLSAEDGDTVDRIEGVILNSAIHASSIVHRNTVVEYSLIKGKVIMHPQTILSSVVVDRTLDIPGGFLYHTVPIRDGKAESFVTIAFGVEDDIKSSLDRNNLKFGGRSLGDLENLSKYLSVEKIFQNREECSLWHGKIFPSSKSMEESFLMTVNLVKMLIEGKGAGMELEDLSFYSMNDLMNMKDCDRIISFKKEISNLCSSQHF